MTLIPRYLRRGTRSRLFMLTQVLFVGGAAPAEPTYLEKCLAIEAASLIGYWPLNEASGATAEDNSAQGNDADYFGVALGETGIGDGLTCPLFDGTDSDYVNLYSAGLAADFDGAEGTLAVWMKVSAAGVWTDGSAHSFGYLYADGNNQIWMYKTPTDNTVKVGYRAGGTIKEVTISGINPTGWTHFALTWSATNDQVIVYLNGAAYGDPLTSLGEWSGSLAANEATLGQNGSGTGSQYWSGWEAHAGLWTVPLSAANVLSLATVS